MSSRSSTNVYMRVSWAMMSLKYLSTDGLLVTPPGNSVMTSLMK